LRALGRAFMEIYVGARARHKVLLNELDQLPKKRRDEIVTAQHELIGLVGAVLSEMAPALKKDDAKRTAATMLFFGMINWTHTWFNPRGPISAEEFADMAATMTACGLGKI
jgi:S-methylmethionine-dependent homocysteine/selenocysteine methylase